eukprot:6200712-Prymnesium_polylepis.1
MSRECTGPCIESLYCEEGSTINTSQACREFRCSSSIYRCKHTHSPPFPHTTEHVSLTYAAIG